MNNLELYNKVRIVPEEAKKPITGGRLKGMTDINPMWRIKALTEQFGPCGIGWYFEITTTRNEWTEIEGIKEVVSTVEGNLYIKVDGEWSKPIYGIGGAKLVSMEKGGMYVDDEALKKASTDALSVACKNLGIGADVYWDKDSDMYIDPKKDNHEPPKSMPAKSASTSNSNASTASNLSNETKELSEQIAKYAQEHGMTLGEIAKDYKLNNETATPERLKEVLADLQSPPSDEFEAIQEQLPWED